jgi:hypothetical protein
VESQADRRVVVLLAMTKSKSLGCGWRVRGLGGFRREGRAAVAVWTKASGPRPAVWTGARGRSYRPSEGEGDETDAVAIAGGAERAPAGGRGDAPTSEGEHRNEAGDAPPKNVATGWGAGSFEAGPEFGAMEASLGVEGGGPFKVSMGSDRWTRGENRARPQPVTRAARPTPRRLQIRARAS